MVRDEKKCVHCGACIGICPTGALSIPDRKTMKVDYDGSKCIACEVCVEACPYRAMSVKI